jgi:hypothetical protein
MNYSIPQNSEEVAALTQQPVDLDLIATAIAGVVQIARSQGQSLDDLTAEILHDDNLLDTVQRHKLSQIIIQAWNRLQVGFEANA